MQKKMLLHIPSCWARLYFRGAMLLILAVAAGIFSEFLRLRAADPLRAALVCAPLLEYLVAACVLACAGVLLLEIARADAEREFR